MKIIGYLNYDYEHLPDPHLLTHINFSFAELYVRNGVYDHFELCGQNIEKLINVVKLKEINPELKVLISFTSQIHNEDNFQDGGFSAICNDENQYKHLTKDIVDFVEKYNLDGIDLNWEYPCEKWSNQTPLEYDKEYFNIFIQYLRETLPKDKIISYASYVLSNKKFHDTLVSKIVNHVNVMCYDLGEGYRHQAHNAVQKFLYTSLSCKYSIESYTRNQIEPSKYIMGIPFYGRFSFKNTGRNPILTLKEIKHLLTTKDYHSEETVNNIPFLFENNGPFGKERPICSYENEYSLYKKIEMVYDNNLGGIMIWNLTQDTDDFYYLKMINNIIKNIKRNEK